MKNVTKIIAVVLVLCMVFIGCGKKNTKGEVVVGDYTGFEITKVNVIVTSEDVNEAISTFLSDNKLETPVTDEGAARGNKVVIDFEGFVDGVAFDGGKATNYTLPSLGYGSFIDGFEESIIGKKAGESYSVDLQFPNPYPNSPDLAGKPVTFEITVKSVAIVSMPEYNDETVRVTAGYDTTAEYEAYLTQQIANEKEQEALALQEQELWSQLLEVTEVKTWPQAEIDEYVAEMKAYFESYAAMFQISYEELLTAYNLGTPEEAEQFMIEDAKATIKNSMVIAYMVEKNNLTYTETEYNDFVNAYATANGMTAEDVTTNFLKEDIEEAVYYQKVIELLRTTAVEVEAAE